MATQQFYQPKSILPILPNELNIDPNKHYVYAHYLNDSPNPFYIGHGYQNRITSTSREDNWWEHTFNGSVTAQYLLINLTKRDAILHEAIAMFNHKHTIINRTLPDDIHVAKPVIRINIHTSDVKLYDSIYHAMLDYPNISTKQIMRCCTNKYSTSNNMLWLFKEDYRKLNYRIDTMKSQERDRWRNKDIVIQKVLKLIHV